MIIPAKIRLEASSLCQLRCPTCPNTTKKIRPIVGNGFLNLNDFKNIVIMNPFVRDIELSNWGEIFLNPSLFQIMEYAYSQNIVLRAANGVNLNDVRDDVLEGLVRYKFNRITCSIDGATNKTYKKYRRGGNFEKVIEHIKKINFFKKQYKSKYPKLTWQFVAFGHNEHEIPMAREMAHDLEMEFFLKLNADFLPIQNQGFVTKEVYAASKQENKETSDVPYMMGLCNQLWDEPQINWDGKVLGCCRNFWGNFDGNAFNDGIFNSVNNEKIRYARKMLLGEKVPRDDIPCTICHIYLYMKANNRFLTRKKWRSWIYNALRLACPRKLYHSLY